MIESVPLQKSSATALPLADVFKKYQSQLRSYIRKRIPSKEDAEDILQNVFYQLARMYEKEATIEQVSGWLYSVTRNQIVDSSRKKKEESLPGYLSEEGDEYVSSEIFDEDFSPEGDLLNKVIREELAAALEELPAEQRTVFELTEMEGFSFKEIAESTGIPINTLLSRKRYAVLHLRERMKELYDDLLIDE